MVGLYELRSPARENVGRKIKEVVLKQTYTITDAPFELIKLYCPVCAEKGENREMKKIGVTGFYTVWVCECGNEALIEK